MGKAQKLVISEGYGIHTFELYLNNLKYTEVQKVIERLTDHGKIQKIKSDPYNIDRHLKSQFFVNDGIRMRIYQSHNCSSGIGFAINPITLLAGKYHPLKLWVPTEDSVEVLFQRLEDMMEKLGLDSSYVKNMTLSQMDITQNMLMINDPSAKIRMCRKGIIPTGFEVITNKDKSLDPYLYTIRSTGTQKKSSKHYKPSSVVIKVYDKIYELKNNDRCPKGMENEAVLRFEVSLKREAFLKKLSLDRDDSLYEMLRIGYDQGKEIIAGYHKKMYPFTGKVVSYDRAKEYIQKKVKNDLLQEQMLYLLKKVSDSTGVSAAVQKLKDHYSHVDDRRIKKIFGKFNELGISPVTQPKG